MNKTPLLIGLAAVLVVVVVLVYGGWSKPKEFSTDDLEKIALADANTDAEKAAQEKAASDLINRGESALPNIRHVLQESKSPVVKAIMLMGVARTYDIDSIEDVFKALDDDSTAVRAQAFTAYLAVMPFKGQYKVEDPHAARVEEIKGLRELWNEKRKK